MDEGEARQFFLLIFQLLQDQHRRLVELDRFRKGLMQMFQDENPSFAFQQAQRDREIRNAEEGGFDDEMLKALDAAVAKLRKSA